MSKEIAGGSFLKSCVGLHNRFDNFPVINIGNISNLCVALTVFSEVKKRCGKIVAGIGGTITFGALCYARENLLKGNAIYPIIPGIILAVYFGMRILESRKKSEDKEQLLSLLMDKHLKLKELKKEYENDLVNLEIEVEEFLEELQQKYENDKTNEIARVDKVYSKLLNNLDDDDLEEVAVVENEDINNREEDNDDEKFVIEDDGKETLEDDQIFDFLDDENLSDESEKVNILEKTKEEKEQDLRNEWDNEKEFLLEKCEGSYDNKIEEAQEKFDAAQEKLHQEYLRSVFEYESNKLIDDKMDKMKMIKTKVL